jgi:hypothetical protein
MRNSGERESFQRSGSPNGCALGCQNRSSSFGGRRLRYTISYVTFILPRNLHRRSSLFTRNPLVGTGNSREFVGGCVPAFQVASRDQQRFVDERSSLVTACSTDLSSERPVHEVPSRQRYSTARRQARRRRSTGRQRRGRPPSEILNGVFVARETPVRRFLNKRGGVRRRMKRKTERFLSGQCSKSPASPEVATASS